MVNVQILHHGSSGHADSIAESDCVADRSSFAAARTMQASLSDASMASRARLDNVKRLFAAAKADDVSSFAGAMDAGDFDVDARLFMSVGPGRYSIPLRQRRGTATCLHVASSAGCRRVVAWLLSAGARPRPEPVPVHRFVISASGQAMCTYICLKERLFPW